MKSTINLLLACVISFHGMSQNFPLSRNLIQVNTKSPEAASLGKFGNVPVSYFTGVPSISIPLYEINIGGISLPISLDYHAGGIRVDETSSSVGLGWALNGIGVISRNVVGRPDELQGGYIGAPNATDVDFDDYQYLYDVRDNFSDTEPDIFQYNVNGLSGKFIFRNDGSIMQIPVTNNKIVFAGGNFTIIDPKGNVYVFEEKRKYFNDEGIGGYPPEYVNTWCISRMLGANSTDVINFTYEAGTYEVYETTTNFTASIGPVLSCYNPPSASGLTSSSIPKTSSHFEYYPKEIVWRGGKISFVNIDDRLDVFGSSLRLDEIKVYSLDNEVYKITKITRLNQSYFYSTPHPIGSPESHRNYRLKLNDVENIDVNANEPVQKYLLTYNETPLPPRGSYAQDRFGFNNGHTENITLMQAQTVFHDDQFFSVGDANRITDETEILAGTLSSIEYPTKGKTIFELEPHRFSTGPSGIGGGLRVKSITNHDVSGAFINKEIYQYGSDGRGTMVTPLFLQEINYETTVKRLGCDPAGCVYDWSGPTATYRANSVHAISQSGGSPVFYDKVTKMHVDASGVVNGKTVYGSNVYTDNFELPGDIGYSELRGGMYSISNAWKNGFLSYEETHKSIGSEYQLISKKVHIYSPQLTESHNVLKVRSIYLHTGCELTNASYASADFNLSVIPVHTGAMLLLSTISTSRDDNGNEIVSTQTFEYESTPLLPSKIHTFSSAGGALMQHIKYPADFASGGNVYQKMLDRNMVSPVIEEQTFKNEDQLTVVTVNYKDWMGDSKLLLPESVTEQVGTNPEEIKVTFNAYDIYGNIIEQQKGNDIHQSYLWGYNNVYPIAEVKNSSNSPTVGEYASTFTLTTQIATSSPEVSFGAPFEIFSNQSLDASVYVSPIGSNAPPSPLLTFILKKPDGTWVQTHSCSWGQNNIASTSLTPGVYQWFYFGGDITFDANFLGLDVALSTNYQAAHTAYKIFHTSFEEDGVVNVGARTGDKIWLGPYTFSLPANNGLYKLSYWKKSGSAEWELIQQDITITSGAVAPITIGEYGALLDEVRFYPALAQMTTYTYDPLVGMRSMTDQNNITTYFQYDGLGRLDIIKDSDKNIVKRYKYHYQNEQ